MEDVLQQAALRAVERAETLREPDRVDAWLFRIHRNAIADALRHRASERTVIDGSAEVPERGSSHAQTDPLGEDPCRCSVSIAKRLRASYASILTLVDSDGLKVGEAARRLDLTANNAAVRLHRARRALKNEMLEHCGVSSSTDCAECRCVYQACCAA